MSRAKIFPLIFGGGLVVLILLGFTTSVFQRLYYRVEYNETIQRVARTRGVDPYLIAAVIFTESRFRPTARSEVGAIGLMQLMPTTAVEVAHELGYRDFEVAMLERPEVNIDIGTAYLKRLQERFVQHRQVLAAYNAGPTLVTHWIEEEQAIPFPETQAFVEEVLRHRDELRDLYPEWTTP